MPRKVKPDDLPSEFLLCRRRHSWPSSGPVEIRVVPQGFQEVERCSQCGYYKITAYDKHGRGKSTPGHKKLPGEERIYPDDYLMLPGHAPTRSEWRLRHFWYQRELQGEEEGNG